MPTDRSPGGERLWRFPPPNDPPPDDPSFGGSFDYIDGGRTPELRHRGHRRKEEDESREEDGPALATRAKGRRKPRDVDAVSTEAIAREHHEQTRRTAPQAPVPLPGDRGASRGHGSGESEFFSYDRDRRTANQPQPSESRQMSGELAPLLALEQYRAPDSVRRKHAPPAENPLVGNRKSPPPPRRKAKSKPESRKTPRPDNRGRLHPEEWLHKRVRNPPSLAGFSRFICPPWRAKKSINLPPLRSKAEMSGALGSLPSVKRRGRSPIKRERSASSGDVVRSEHRNNSNSGISNGSKGPARRQGSTVKDGQNLPAARKERRGSRGEGRLDVNV